MGPNIDTTSTGIDVTGNATFADNGKAIFGAGSDLQIYHNSANNKSYIEESGTGNLVIRGSDIDILAGNGEAAITVAQDGAVTLYNDNNAKLATSSSGVTVNSTLDLESYGSDAIIRNDSGPVFMQSNSSVKFTDIGNNETFAVFNDNGAVDLYYDNIARLSTTSSGITVTGDATATNFNTTSDATLKTNVETLSGSLDAVKALRGVSFDWLENGGSEIGVIAQEVEAVLPDVVSTNDEGIKSVKYGNMVAVLIEAIKEQQLRIEVLEAKLNSKEITDAK